MQFDFWNNPLVVSAMRLKYRRSSPGLVACLYVLALMGMGALLFYNQATLSIPVGRYYLASIFGIQFMLSALIGLVTVSSSMNAEVNNRTFDFQRVVSLSPREILVGKMIGEPALSYFLAMSTVPLVVFCWFHGGATLVAILLFYVNLITFTMMCAALGLLHTLAEPNQTPGKPRTGSIGGLAFMAFIFLPSMISRGAEAFSNPWVGLLFNLLTPISSLLELGRGDPFAAQVQLWGISVPSLLVAPVAQLAVTAWFVQAMSRRLQSPNQTVFGRNDVYLVLLVVDLLVAGVCFAQWKRNWPTDELVAQFCLAHLIASLILLLGATPSRTMLMSWLWRFRYRQSWARDSVWFSRAEITLALLAMWAISVGVLMTSFVLPISLASRGSPQPFSWENLGELAIVMGVLLYALGISCQWSQAYFGKSGIIVFVCGVIFLNLIPPLLAGLLEFGDVISGRDHVSDLVYALSPIAYFSSRIDSAWGYPLPSLPLIVAYLLFASVAHTARFAFGQTFVPNQSHKRSNRSLPFLE